MTTEIQLHITVSSGDQGSLPNNIIIDCGQLLGVIFGLNLKLKQVLRCSFSDLNFINNSYSIILLYIFVFGEMLR